MIASFDAPMHVSDPIRLKCPHCGQRLAILEDQNAMRTIYHCHQHGRFWIHEGGALREEQRTTDRPKSFG